MKEKQKLRNVRGITLVALVVTIIVLIILAGVSISLVLGENGIITKSKYAKQETLNAQMEEQGELNEVVSYIENLGSTEKSEVEKYRDAETFMTEKTTVKDSNGNLIKVPAGFKIAQDSGKNVTEGIVIEDDDKSEGIGNNRGNQYVWIPVGTGIKKSDGTTVDITLGRYVFADGTNHKAEDGTTVLAKGTPILMQSAENYADETEIHITDINPTSTLNYRYKELTTKRDGVASSGADGENATALSILNFKTSVEANGGYYIARYEASYGVDGKVNSKVSNSRSGSTAPTEEGQLWTNITQINAARACRKINEENNNYTVDLINSYAWDTAIVYIQEFSGDEDYSYQDGRSINPTLSNTGNLEILSSSSSSSSSLSSSSTGNLAENIKDEVCKINDMASNAREYTTEYSSYTIKFSGAGIGSYPCTFRGGFYQNIDECVGNRKSNNTEQTYFGTTFRGVLYM